MNQGNYHPIVHRFAVILSGATLLLIFVVNAFASRQPLIKPVFVANVTETTALGYVNSPKFFFDRDGFAYFSATSQGPNFTPAIELFRSREKWPNIKSFDRFFLENTDTLSVSSTLHFSQSICLGSNQTVYIVWAGGKTFSQSDPGIAHQIRNAAVEFGGGLKLGKEEQPFVVTGFSDVYDVPYTNEQFWQERPSVAKTIDGILHVVWEARDKNRLADDGTPYPAIAYAWRDPSGKWSVSGPIDRPPYLSAQGISEAQFDPLILTNGTDPIHVLCTGDVDERNQILYGQIRGGKFSGWKMVAYSPYDQGQVTAVLDSEGNLHVAWREGEVNGRVFISHCEMKKNGTWSSPDIIGLDYTLDSTPSIAIDGSKITIAWISWEPGFINSDGEEDNNFPEDDDTVEGRLFIATKQIGANNFTDPKELIGGICSYPNLGVEDVTSKGRTAIIWASGQECVPKDCVQLFFGTLPKK